MTCLHHLTLSGWAGVMQHNLHLSEEQNNNLFLLRRAFLRKQALLQNQQHELQLELDSADHSCGPCSSGNHADEASQQMWELDRQMQETYFAYKGVIYDGVSKAASVIGVLPFFPGHMWPFAHRCVSSRTDGCIILVCLSGIHGVVQLATKSQISLGI